MPAPDDTSKPPADAASPPEDKQASEAAANRNLAVRLTTGFTGIPILIGIVFYGPPWLFLVVVVIAAGIAGQELGAMAMPGKPLHQAWMIAASAGLAAVMLFVPDPRASTVALIAIPALGLLVSLVAPEPLDHASTRVPWLIAGPLYGGAMVATVGLLHTLPEHGWWVLLSMSLAWAGDTGAYFAGRFLGRTKLFPAVSPKKTVEGSIGGLLGSITGACFASLLYLPRLPLGWGILLAIVAGSLGQAGDLCESLVKRATGVKDSGKLLPGHGGLLDRIDALVFTSATTWIFATFLLDEL